MINRVAAVSGKIPSSSTGLLSDMWHFHSYKLVGTDPFIRNLIWGNEKYGQDTRTTLLYKCSRCDKVKTKEFDGLWMLQNGELVPRPR